MQTLKTALVTFIYPSACKYLPSFVKYLNQQSTQEFYILIFNDGIECPDKWFSELKIPFRIISMSSTSLMTTRFEALSFLKETSFEKFIFQDSDDGLSTNRVEVLDRFLDKYKLVVNDLDLMDIDGHLTSHKIWTNRFKSNSEFNADNILEYNFVGLGNTGIKKEMLDFVPEKPIDDIIAVDWFLFFNMLKTSKEIGFRTSECSTYYRQHSDNTIGVSENTKLEQIKATRKLHFKAIKRLLNYTVIAQDEENIIVPKKKNHQYPYWWEIKKK